MLGRKKVVIVFIILLVSLLVITIIYRQSKLPIYAGFYSEGVHPDYLVNIAKRMASAIPSASPSGMFVVRQVPPPSLPDMNEDSFKAFDDNRIKVVLQVEPGYANISQLIDLYLGRYGNHSCILGFGMDLEWRPNIGGMIPVTDDEAETWVNQIKKYNPNFKLFLTHWDTSYLPPTARQDIVFIDDSQNHGSLESMINAFKNWGEHFSETEVGFIVGYGSDRGWWSTLEDPPRDIGSALIKNIPNCRYIIWYHPETSLTPAYPKYSQSPLYHLDKRNDAEKESGLFPEDKIKCSPIALFFKVECIDIIAGKALADVEKEKN